MQSENKIYVQSELIKRISGQFLHNINKQIRNLEAKNSILTHATLHDVSRAVSQSLQPAAH